jgi:hypothetical protein
MPIPPGQPVLECSIELSDVEPRVWRRLLVPGSVRLDKLHRIFQAAMGWQDYHLHSFEIGGERYGMHFDERFVYEYDFGDSWEHDVTVHAAWRMPIGLKFAVCLDGAKACPPEDSGGPGGYEDLLRVLGDPSHEEHEHLRGWIGDGFDPREFDLALANARLQAVR